MLFQIGLGYISNEMAIVTKQLIGKVAGAASFAVPLALGILAASPEPYWLDSPEFTAAAQTLGIPHPPGHPLYVMLVKPFTLLPLGGIAFRVALASAFFGAIASYILFHLIGKVIGVTAPDLPVWARALIAFATSLTASVSQGWWFQCVRAEVYALQIAIVLGALYPLVLYCLKPSKSNDHLLFTAAFVTGLGMTNHHFIMLAAVPAAIPVIVAQARYRGGLGSLKLSGKLLAAGAAGLLPYLFLPIRSASGAAVSLGGVHSFKDFFWVVSAKVYQKSMEKEHAASLTERSVDALFTMMGEIGPIILVAAAAGLYLLLRRQPTRMIGLVLTLVIAITILLRSVMGFDPFNPDYYGYMLPALACMAAGFAAFAAILIDAVMRNLKRGPQVAIVLIIALTILPVARARKARPKVDLSSFRTTRLVFDLSLDRAKPGTLVLSSNYKLFFVLWSARFIDGSRPDITVINPQMFGYPGYLRTTLLEHPKLRPLARSMVAHGKITESTAADLAWKGPLRIEPDLWLPEEVTRYMLPDAPVYHSSPEPLSAADIVAASPAYMVRWRRFYHLLGPDWQEHETWRMLSWCHYLDALFLARRGDRSGAVHAIEMSLALGNKAPQIQALREVLEKEKRGPLNITPFLPEAVVRQQKNQKK